MAVRFIHLPRFYPSLTIFFPFSYLLRIYTLKRRLQYLINFTIELKHFTNNNYSIIQFLHLHSYYHFIRYIYILIISYVYKLLSTHIYIFLISPLNHLIRICDLSTRLISFTREIFTRVSRNGFVTVPRPIFLAKNNDHVDANPSLLINT